MLSETFHNREVHKWIWWQWVREKLRKRMKNAITGKINRMGTDDNKHWYSLRDRWDFQLCVLYLKVPLPFRTAPIVFLKNWLLYSKRFYLFTGLKKVKVHMCAEMHICFFITHGIRHALVLVHVFPFYKYIRRRNRKERGNRSSDGELWML